VRPPDDLLVWPENMPAVDVFCAMLTQWHYAGMGGIVGLRYEALPVVLALRGIQAADQPDIFEALGVMEGAALDEVRHG